MFKQLQTKFLALLAIMLMGGSYAWANQAVWPGTQALPGTLTNVGNDTNIQIMVSSANDYTNPLRVYANTTITIKAQNGCTIQSVVYEASSTGSYVTNAQTATVTPSVTPKVDGTNVTWTFADNDNVTVFTFKPSAQTRANSITINYTTNGGGSETGQVATPTFTPAGGTYTSAQTVTLTCATDGATIYYTTDGNDPTTNSSVYSSSINVSSTTTIKAMAAKEGMNNSAVATATYTIENTPPVTGYNVDFESDLDLYTDWNFTNAARVETGTIEAHDGGYYATTGGKESASFQTKTAVAYPENFTCYVSKLSNNTTASTWKIQVSANGTSWTDVASQDATSMSKGDWVEFTARLSSYTNVYVRLYYSGSTAVRAVDDISLTTYVPEPHTVTLADDNSTLTETSGGAGVKLPTRNALGNYTFAGWSETNVTTETTEAPTIVAAETYHPKADVTLYPVYTRSEGSATTETATVSISDYATANEWENSQAYQPLVMDENVSVGGVISGNNFKYYNSDDSWRFYAGGSFTVSTTATALNTVKLTFSTGTILYGEDEITSNNAVTVSGTSATFDVTVNTRITAIEVTYTAGSTTTYYWSNPGATVSISPVGLATFCSKYALDFSGVSDVWAYIAKYESDKVTYQRVEIVPANTGVLLRNKLGEAAISCVVPFLAINAEGVTGNKFIGTLEDITLPSVDETNTNYNYILNNGDNGVGFYKANGKKVGAGKAYLQLPKTAAKTFIGFDEEGEATAISTIDNGQLTMDNAYNLQGQKVGSEYKGIVIVNGKKFINK